MLISLPFPNEEDFFLLLLFFWMHFQLGMTEIFWANSFCSATKIKRVCFEFCISFPLARKYFTWWSFFDLAYKKRQQFLKIIGFFNFNVVNALQRFVIAIKSVLKTIFQQKIPFTVDSKIIRLLEMIRVKKLILYAALCIKYLSNHDL